MTALNSILISLAIHFGFNHDIKMAIFEIYQGKSGLEMTISVDKEDFLKALAAESPSGITSENLGGMAFDYLVSKIAIEVNGECALLALHEIEFSNLNIHLRGKLNTQVCKVEEVRMTNTCMIDLFEDHDNIMKLKLNDRTRSFRLNSKRTTTVATY